MNANEFYNSSNNENINREPFNLGEYAKQVRAEVKSLEDAYNAKKGVKTDVKPEGNK